jgi:hypothetical protein
MVRSLGFVGAGRSVDVVVSQKQKSMPAKNWHKVPARLVKTMRLQIPKRVKMRLELKPAPAPNVPGKTEFERFDNAVTKLLSIPKKAFLREEDKLKRRREKKRAAKKSG